MPALCRALTRLQMHDARGENLSQTCSLNSGEKNFSHRFDLIWKNFLQFR